jgi:hypothetical protein
MSKRVQFEGVPTDYPWPEEKKLRRVKSVYENDKKGFTAVLYYNSVLSCFKLRLEILDNSEGTGITLEETMYFYLEEFDCFADLVRAAESTATKWLVQARKSLKLLKKASYKHIHSEMNTADVSY